MIWIMYFVGYFAIGSIVGGACLRYAKAVGIPKEHEYDLTQSTYMSWGLFAWPVMIFFLAAKFIGGDTRKIEIDSYGFRSEKIELTRRQKREIEHKRQLAMVTRDLNDEVERIERLYREQLRERW